MTSEAADAVGRARYTTPTTFSVTTDAVGNLNARGTSTYAYDGANRLTSATVAGSSETCAYDGDGVRVNRTVGRTRPSST